MLTQTILPFVLLATGAHAVAVTRRAVAFPANGKADYQLGGAYTPDVDVKIVTRDRTASAVAGLFNICYINAFQTQPEETAWWKANHDDLLLRKSSGDYFEDPDWEGELFLDTRTAAKRTAIAAVLNAYIDGCATKGFNAIEPDNLDTFTRSDGLLTADNNLALAKLLADHSHAKGLLFAQKNTGGELQGRGKATVGFDFAVAEECQRYLECDSYTSVYGVNIIEIEYTDYAQSVYTNACTARGATTSIILRDREVVPKGQSAYRYKTC